MAKTLDQILEHGKCPKLRLLTFLQEFRELCRKHDIDMVEPMGRKHHEFVVGECLYYAPVGTFCTDDLHKVQLDLIQQGLPPERRDG